MPPESIPLTGADCFLRAFDDEVRRYHQASHVSQLVLRLGPGFSVEALQAVIEKVTLAQPILRAPIGRTGVAGLPAYRTDRSPGAPMPQIRIHERTGPPPQDQVPDLFFAALNEPFRRKQGDLLHFDVVRYEEGRLGTDLAVSWLHMLFDGSGSETFVTFLNECFEGTQEPAHPPTPAPPARPPKPTLISERGERARRWQKQLHAMGDRPPSSLAGPLQKGPQKLRYQISTLDADATIQVVERAKENAGFLTPMLFYLAAAIRAHHAVFRQRDQVPQSYVVPLPANARQKGSEGPMFRTHVSLLWFQVDPMIVDDFAALIANLKAQRQQAIRSQSAEDALCAMDFARYAPQRLYAHMARRGFKGELASFFFAYTGEFAPRLTTFLGTPITQAFHAAPVPPSPGSSLAFSLRSGHLNITHLYQEDVLAAAELDALQAQLRLDLLN